MAIWQTWQHTQDYTYRYCDTAGPFIFSHYILSSLYTIIITYLHIVEELLRARCPRRCWYDLGKLKDLQNLSQLLVCPGGSWRLLVTAFSKSAGRVTGPQVCIRLNLLSFSLWGFTASASLASGVSLASLWLMSVLLVWIASGSKGWPQGPLVQTDLCPRSSVQTSLEQTGCFCTA